jgi:magnesium transporter
MQAQQEVKASTGKGGCTPRIVAFDFEAKRETELQLEQLEAAFEVGHFVWLDLAFSDVEQARELLGAFGMLAPETIEAALTRAPATQLAHYDEYVHFAVSACEVVDGRLQLARVDCAISERSMNTIHRDGVRFVESMRRNYHHDFARLARTPSFLVFELWDKLIDSYLGVQRDLEAQVANLQSTLMSHDESETVFLDVAQLGAELLDFRKVVLLARGVLNDLATRPSIYVSETSQGRLLNLVGSLEHVLQELLVDRDVLAQSLNLHMSLVSHRTNLVMKKLTAANFVFLPLTFMCGVYGMNFRNFPELEWAHGYALFWLMAATLVGAVAWLTRRLRLW